MKKVLLYIIIGLSVILFLLANSYKNLMDSYLKSSNNNKAYERLLDSTKNNNIQFQLTIKELENSKDSIFAEMNKVREELKIKDKNLKQIQYIKTETKIIDSIIVRDTIFREDFYLDTVLFDEWHATIINLAYPSSIKAKSIFKNETYITTSLKKETINPPSKIFFIRWFQKKQKVVEVNVIQKNPYTENCEQRFIEVVK